MLSAKLTCIYSSQWSCRSIYTSILAVPKGYEASTIFLSPFHFSCVLRLLQKSLFHPKLCKVFPESNRIFLSVSLNVPDIAAVPIGIHRAS